MKMDNWGNLIGIIIMGVIALISWALKAAKKAQQQQGQQRVPILKESATETPSTEQKPTGIQIAMQKLFGMEEDEEYEEVVETPEPEPEPAPAEAPEEKPVPSVEQVTAEVKSPEEMRKKLVEIVGMPLNPQNIRYGVIFSEILKRPTPRILRK